MQKLVAKRPNYFICSLQRKSDFWAEIEAEYELRQLEDQDSLNG